MIETVVLGNCHMSFEPPDLIRSEMIGEVDGPTAAMMMRQLVEWLRGRPYMLILADVSSLGAFSPAARRELTVHGHKLPPRALAVYGAGTHARETTEFLARASELLGTTNRFGFHCETEAEARAWLDSMRPKLSGL